MSTKPGISSATVTDGLREFDLIQYQARRAPNYSEEQRFREWHHVEFCGMIKEQDDLVETLLRERSTGPLDVAGLEKLYTTAEPLSVLYYAAKYMLHRKLIDRFQDQGHSLAAEREIYLLGQTWAEGQFTEYRDLAVRGMANKAASDAGAEARRGKLEAATRARLAEMQRLIDAGQTVENAALLAAKNGMGKSQGANKALWYRHRPKKS